MSPERDEEMPAEFDMNGGVRGKYVERYRRWASKHSITAATGAVDVCAVTSTGAEIQTEITMSHVQVLDMTGPILRGLGPVIAPADSEVAANALVPVNAL
jgi:hypothetical protein